MLLNKINQLSFKYLVLGITALTFAILTFLIAFFSSLNAANELAKGVYQQGFNLSRSLADNSVVPLLYDSAANAKILITTSFGIKSISEARIIRLSGAPLISKKTTSHVDHSYPSVSIDNPNNVNETEYGWYFTSLVTTQSTISDTATELLELTDENVKQEVLGYVNLALSKDNIYITRRHIFIDNFILAAAIGFVLLILMYLALRRITQPLEELSHLMEQGQRGEYHASAGTHYPKEISQISRSFNSMIHAISEREQNLVLTLNSIADGVLVTDDNGIIIRANPKAAQILNKSTSQIISKHINDIVHLEDAYSDEIIDCPVCTAIRKAESIEYKEPLQLKIDGNKKCIITCSASPIINPDHDKINGAVLVIHDITEKQKQSEMLRRSQKLEALGKMTSGIAHDYNNMLAIAIGYAELLKNEIAGQPKCENYTQQIIHACQRGANLTRKLLTFSRSGVTQKETLDINKLLNNEKDMLEKTLTARIQLIFELDDTIAPVMLNAADFEDAIINMSINSMHAMDGRGQLTICTRNHIVSKEDAASYRVTPGNYVSISITDTGCGISKEQLNNVFDPFFTTKGSMGTGLGLSQVHSFVTRSKGIIDIYSEPGHGTKITMSFPVIDDSSETLSNQPKDVDIRQFNGTETILIVDDEPVLRQLTTQILENSGYTVFTAENGASALQLLKVQKIDLLFTDIIMPGMDGYELAKEVRRYFPDMPIQFASGFNDPRMKEQAGLDEEFDILQKPYDHLVLLKLIRQQLDRV